LRPFMEDVLPRYRSRCIFSLDTRNAVTARRALQQGIGWINDVSGFADPAMADAVAQSQCMLVVMHSLSVPADPGVTLPEDKDPVAVLLEFASARLGALESRGIARGRMIFDPGIGF